MSEQDRQSADIDVETGDFSRPTNLPRVLDPVVTMGVVQKYIESERVKSRQILFWMSSLFAFVALCIFVLFISTGIYLYQKARNAVEISDSVRAQVAYYGAEVVGISNKMNTLEEKDNQIKDLVRTVENNRSEESTTFKSDLRRFSDHIESVNARERKVLSELETRLREMQRALETKDRELEDVKKQYSALLASAGPTRRYVNDVIQYDNANASAPDRVDAPDGDISNISTAGLFDAVLSMREINVVARFEPKGEISVVTFPGGDRYEGEFKGGLLNGKGVYYYRNGDKYEGEFKNDMKHGLGMYTYSNGDRCTGEFKNDMKDGKGSFVFQNGEKYVGDFRNDSMTGKGTMIYVNGNKYAGNFKNGLKNGNGILCFHNGDIYKGEFVDDLRNGKGAYFYVDGAKYIGEFRNDKRHGHGRYIYPGGEEYVGEFKEGKKNGEGVCIYPNGKQLKGLWKNDKFIEEIRGS